MICKVETKKWSNDAKITNDHLDFTHSGSFG